MSKKTIQHLLVLLLLIPLLFFNIKDSHDWGDDFAQYIHQSQNLLHNISQDQTGVVFNEGHFIGPVAYPVGFPLILAPVLKIVGYDLPVLNIYLSMFLLLSCFIGFLFLRRQFSFQTSLITTLIIAYNPILLSLKTEILSDLPYVFFSSLGLLLITGKLNMWRHISIGVIIALSVHIRSVGYVLLFIYLLSILFKLIDQKNMEKEIVKPFVYGLTAFLAVYLFLKFKFPCNTNYPFPIEAGNLWTHLNTQITYNLHNLFAFFKKYDGSPFNYLGLLGASALLCFSIIGAIHSWRSNKKDLINYYVLTYILVIICVKFGDAGFRFIIPVLFFLFAYSILGLSKTIDSMMMSKKWMPFVFGALIFFSYKIELVELFRNEKNITEGPEKPDAKKLFEYINSNLTETDIIEFEKPRVIALYSKARSVAIKPVQTEIEIKNDLQKFKANYILVHYILTDNPIRQYTQNPSNDCVSVFKTNDLELFKVN